MDRREMIKKGLWSTALIPFVYGEAHGHEYPTNKTRYCEHCGKEVAWKETTLLEKTAHDTHNDCRTYAVAGLVIFHTDGTRCQEERIKFEVLEDPVVHKNLGRIK